MVSSGIDVASQALGLLRANTISSFTEGLNQTTAPINEWKYSHIVPAEALRIWALYASDAVGATPVNDYDIQAPSGARRIFSNNDVIYGEYTVYSDESNWPAYFSHFAMHAFAALIAIPVTDDDNLAVQLKTLAWGTPSEGEKGGKFAVATGIDAQQKPPELIADCPFISMRFS